MSGVSLDRLLFDPADPTNSPLVGSYLLGAGGDVLTSTTVGGDKGLDVNLITADVDIRDLVYATDSVTVHINSTDNAVKITDGTDTLAIDASGYITANINGTVTVSASDLDIRDLTHVSDSIKIGDGTDFMAVNTDGSINVNAIHTPPVGATKSTATGVTNVAAALPATALAARRYMDVQNRSSVSIFIGDSSVTTSTGLEITKGGNKEIEVGPGQVIYAIAAAAGPYSVVTFERA